MPRLTTTLTATAFASLGWLEYSAITGRSFGVVTGAASDSFAQAGKFGRQVSELSAELLDPLLLLLVMLDQIKQFSLHANRCTGPVRF